MQIVWKTGARTGDGMEFVLSDATVDRYGDVIEPDGWDLRQFKRNPIALFSHQGGFPIGAWEGLRVEGGKLLGKLQLAAKGTSERIDELIGLVEQGILRAVSVGFVPKAKEPLDKRGTRYTKQELVEVSLVSVPANPAAVAVARSLGTSDATMALVFGKHAALETRAMSTGKHADSNPRTRGTTIMNISQQIEDVQGRLNAAKDVLLDYTKNPDHDHEQAQQYNDEIEFLEKDLASKQRTERNISVRAAATVIEPEPGKALVPRRPLTVPATATDKDDYLWRAATAGFISVAKRQSVEDTLRERYALERYPDAEATGWVTRAAISGALTSVPAWAGDLVQQGQAAFLSRLMPDRVFPRLAALGTSLNFGPEQGTIKIPSRATTPSISGSFVAEGQPIPVRRLGLTSITLAPNKIGGISVYSREMALYSNPSIEGIIRQGMTEDTGITVDTLLLDATAGSTTRPPGLLFGISTAGAASTAKGYAAILADLALLSAPFYASNAGGRLALIMNPAQGMQLGFAPGPDGTFGWAQQFTQRFTVIESTIVAAGTVLMVDAADFVSVNGGVEFDISEQATLHMEDTTPLQISTVGAPNVVAAPVQSMYQTAQIAIRMLLTITWAMRRTGMVQYITGANWAPA